MVARGRMAENSNNTAVVVPTKGLFRGLRRKAPAAVATTTTTNKPTEKKNPSPEKPFATRRFSLRSSSPREANQQKPAKKNEENNDNRLQQQTRIMTVTAVAPQPAHHDHQDDFDEAFYLDELPTSQCCADSGTAILQHSYYWEKFLQCGGGGASVSGEEELRPMLLSEDPTIQESIECIFASQLQEGLPQLLFDDDDEYATQQDMLVAPSSLQQSLLKSRSDSIFRSTTTTSPVVRKRKVQGKLIHVRTLDTTNSQNQDILEQPEQSPSPVAQRFESKAGGICSCCRQKRPLLTPSQWPQRPLLLRPAGGTRCKGIRYAADCDHYLWKARKSGLTWPAVLREHWGREQDTAGAAACDILCPECMVLPINNGNEEYGRAVVSDFETDLFEGTLLLRLRFAEGTTPESYADDRGYFAGMNRRYQAVIQGRFKKEIPLTECVTGFVLDRPCGKLPAKFIVKGALKVISFFAPQLDARLDGLHPHCITPLGSTPQTIIVQDADHAVHVEDSHQEPVLDDNTLLHKACPAPDTTSMQRARFRKKAFDKLYANKSPEPVTDTSKIYTFEFLQHLVDFQDLTLAGVLGTIPLAPILDGQPLQIMARYGDEPLWAFDVWHEALYRDAARVDEQNERR